MSLACTSPTLRRLLLEPIPIHSLCTPAIRHAIGAAHCQLTTRRRRPWAHQTRFASNDPRGTPEEKDPYKVLGVPRNVSQRGLQKAYYEQAKKLHPDTSKEDRTKFQDLSAAYEILKTPGARETYDSKVRALERELERERAAQRATPQAAQPRPQSKKSEKSSGGSAKFVNRASLNWMKNYQRAKQEAEAQKEKDLAAQRAAQRERDLAAQRRNDADAQKQKEMLDRQEKERRDRESALRDNEKPKEPDQRNAVNTASTSPDNGVKSEPKDEPRGKPRGESRVDPKYEPVAGGRTHHNDKGGAPPTQKQTVTPKSEPLRVVIFSVGPGVSIEDVVKPLASSAIGKLALIQITPAGTAKLDFFTDEAARKLHQLSREDKFVVYGKKVRGMTLHASALPIPLDPNASRVLLLTDSCDDKMPVLESSNVKFMLRQEGHDCRWVEVRRLSRTRTEVHFSSFWEAERAGQILQNLIPGVHIRYAIDPATGNKEPGTSFLKWAATGEDLPDTLFYRFVRGAWFALLAGCCCLLVHEYYEQ